MRNLGEPAICIPGLKVKKISPPKEAPTVHFFLERCEIRWRRVKFTFGETHSLISTPLNNCVKEPKSGGNWSDKNLFKK